MLWELTGGSSAGGWLDLTSYPPEASFWSLYGDCRDKPGDRESSEEAVTIIQLRDDGGLDKSGTWGGGEKWLDA